MAQVLIWDQLHTLSDDYQLAFKKQVYWPTAVYFISRWGEQLTTRMADHEHGLNLEYLLWFISLEKTSSWVSIQAKSCTSSYMPPYRFWNRPLQVIGSDFANLLHLHPCISRTPDVFSGMRGVWHEQNRCSLLRIHLALCRCKFSDPIRCPGRNLYWTHKVLHNHDKTRLHLCDISSQLYKWHSNFPCHRVQVGCDGHSKKPDFTDFSG